MKIIILISIFLIFSCYVSAANKIDIFPTIGGQLILIGDDEDIVISDKMAVYLNDVKLFRSDNIPELHAYFSGLYHGDIAVVGMCANGGCLYRIIEIYNNGNFLYSEEIGFARIERAKITHDFHGGFIQLNEYQYNLQLNPE